MNRLSITACAAVVALGSLVSVSAQAPRPLSPPGTAAANVLGRWVKPEKQTFAMGGERYEGGKWIEIVYSRPMMRGRQVFTGTGAEYGKATNAGAPVWRAGANVSTRLKTEVPLRLGTATVPPGEYSLFIELNSATTWTLIVSNWAAAPRMDPSIKDALWGAFDYTPDKDVARAPMKVDALPYTVEQLTWQFLDMTVDSGRIALMWDRSIGSTPFTVVH